MVKWQCTRWRALAYSLLHKEGQCTFEERNSALGRNSSSREFIRRYITAVLRARFLQMAACTYSDNCIIIGRPTANNRKRNLLGRLGIHASCSYSNNMLGFNSVRITTFFSSYIDLLIK